MAVHASLVFFQRRTEKSWWRMWEWRDPHAPWWKVWLWRRTTTTYRLDDRMWHLMVEVSAADLTFTVVCETQEDFLRTRVAIAALPDEAPLVTAALVPEEELTGWLVRWQLLWVPTYHDVQLISPAINIARKPA